VYDTAGFLPYLAFDGLDDSMSTNSIDFSAGDKVTAWIGARSFIASGLQFFFELSATVTSSNGSFALLRSGGSYAFSSRGTVEQSAGTSHGAPETIVLTNIGDISLPKVSIARNGGVEISTTASQGTGNYGNYPLYIGMRNNVSFPFNGWLTSLIIRGAQSTQSQIEATEAWVAGKTGVQL
jgi:hypothetical protein